MAKKTKRISINALEKAISEAEKPTPIVKSWRDVDIIIKPSLGLHEMLSFVDTVVKMCFTYTDGTYMPELKDFGIKSCLIDFYTNLSLPSNVEKKYDYIENCKEVIQFILETIDLEQYDSMMIGIDKKIEHIAQSNIGALSARMNELYNSFSNIEKQFNDTLGGVTKKDVDTIIGAVSKYGIDEQKLVKAIYDEKQKSEDSDE